MNVKNAAHQDPSKLFKTDPLSSFKDIVRMQIRRQLSHENDDSFNPGRITEFPMHGTRLKDGDHIVFHSQRSKIFNSSLRDKDENKGPSIDEKDNQVLLNDFCVTNFQTFSPTVETIPLSSRQHRDVAKKDTHTAVPFVQNSHKKQDLNKQEGKKTSFQSVEACHQKADLSYKRQTLSSKLTSVPQQNTKSIIEPVLDKRLSPDSTQLINSEGTSLGGETEYDPAPNLKSVCNYSSQNSTLEITPKLITTKKDVKVTKWIKNTRHDEGPSATTDNENNVLELFEYLDDESLLLPVQVTKRRRCTATCVLSHFIIILTLFFSFLAKFASEILPEFSLSCGHLEAYWFAFIEFILDYVEQFLHMSYLHGPPPV